MEKSNNDIWFMVLIVVVIIGIWGFLYTQGILDGKLPEPVKNKTVKEEIKKVKEVLPIKKENNMEDYKKTESGLEYKVIKMGNGPKPVCNAEKCDTVEVHYEGKFEDGKVFDSSYARGQKISFPLNGVIAGWTEGLQLMPVGSEFEFKIPANLAYGENDYHGIPGGSTLIFKVELFDIK